MSSAEDELVGMVHCIQMAESIQPLVDELLEDDSVIAVLADNSAAVRAFESSPSRNRHLRMRAVAGRERIAAGGLTVSHLFGGVSYQVADLGTKPLARPRILRLLELINVKVERVASEAIRAARVLSRQGREGLAVSPTALAGLALLSLIPKAQAQPEVVRSGYTWRPKP